MENTSKIIAPYGVNKEGKGKALVFEADLTNKDESASIHTLRFLLKLYTTQD
jgi:hypothetical protein